jgi:hypothetical protein
VPQNLLQSVSAGSGNCINLSKQLVAQARQFADFARGAAKAAANSTEL